VLLTITTTRPPATELGYLLHKHPDRSQSFAVSAGQAHVFYPEATPERCTAALLLDIDPVALVRDRKNGELAQYVNDRPYAAASMLAVAVKQAFRTALTGRCDARPDLAATPIPLGLHVPALRCRGGRTLADRVFAPLGWSVDAQAKPYTPETWGDSPYLDLRLKGELRLADALNHLYVLLPVLDDAKHYWVSTEEVDKLIRAGGDWLARHPEKELITRRYLSHQKKLTRSALARLAEADDTEPEEFDNAVPENEEENEENRDKPLAVQRREAILAVLDAAVLMEVVEHVDPDRLPALERVVFREAAPGTVVVTTPNAEYNVHFPTLEPGAPRHRDHRFEWTRAEFRAWADRIAETYTYEVNFLPVGPEHPQDGPPTQLAVFERGDTP
jgi:3' terminal RNA ribose 2'-O-methyltransferase Hen1